MSGNLNHQQGGGKLVEERTRLGGFLKFVLKICFLGRKIQVTRNPQLIKMKRKEERTSLGFLNFVSRIFFLGRKIRVARNPQLIKMKRKGLRS